MAIAMRMRRIFLSVVCLLAAAGLAVPAQAQQAPATADYTLNPGDLIDIAVWKELELTKTVVVRPDGKFSFPLAGEIQAAGRTIAQVQTEITNKLKTYIPEAVVTAAVKELDGYRVYVIGQVGKPGSFVMNPRMSVLQALTVAGGMTPFAGPNNIIVLRGAGSAQRVIPFHYNEVVKGQNLPQNIQLEAGDVVVVP
jgi:polysaccharide export outer membrane protein